MAAPRPALSPRFGALETPTCKGNPVTPLDSRPLWSVVGRNTDNMEVTFSCLVRLKEKSSSAPASLNLPGLGLHLKMQARTQTSLQLGTTG